MTEKLRKFCENAQKDDFNIQTGCKALVEMHNTYGKVLSIYNLGALKKNKKLCI